MATKNQISRQSASNQKMRRRGYRTYDGPLYVDDDAEAILRTPSETLRRAMILWLLGCAADGASIEEMRGAINSCGLGPDLSPMEREYVARAFEDERVQINMKWRLEASWVLLWALKRLWRLNWADSLCDCFRMADILTPLESAEGVRRIFTMHSKVEILDKLDLTLRQHWAARDAYVRGENILPPNLGKVAQQRHHALLWLTTDTTWDEVETHT